MACQSGGGERAGGRGAAPAGPQLERRAGRGRGSARQRGPAGVHGQELIGARSTAPPPPHAAHLHHVGRHLPRLAQQLRAHLRGQEQRAGSSGGGAQQRLAAAHATASACAAAHCSPPTASPAHHPPPAAPGCQTVPRARSRLLPSRPQPSWHPSHRARHPPPAAPGTAPGSQRPAACGAPASPPPRCGGGRAEAEEEGVGLAAS